MFDQGEGGLARPLVQENIPIALTDEVNLPRDDMKKKLLSTSLIGIHFRLFYPGLGYFRGFSSLLFPLIVSSAFLCLGMTELVDLPSLFPPFLASFAPVIQTLFVQSVRTN